MKTITRIQGRGTCETQRREGICHGYSTHSVFIYEFIKPVVTRQLRSLTLTATPDRSSFHGASGEISPSYELIMVERYILSILLAESGQHYRTSHITKQITRRVIDCQALNIRYFVDTPIYYELNSMASKMLCTTIRILCLTRLCKYKPHGNGNAIICSLIFYSSFTISRPLTCTYQLNCTSIILAEEDSIS